MERITTHGMSMPKLGLGTFRLRGAECAEAVSRALGLGYRHLDTAEMYGNEEGVGEGMARSGVPRGDIHLTTKVWWEHLGGDDMATAAEASLRRLGCDYVDLYLIHWPAPDMQLDDAMAKLLRLRERGLARAVGVSNFPAALFERAVALGAPLAANQVEYHVLLGQRRLLGAVRAHGAALTAYAPLAQGRLAEYAALRDVADKHRATPAQVALKWLLDQDGVAAIPKAGREESQRANLQALELALDDDDRVRLDALPKGERFVNPGFAPAWDEPG